MAGRTNTDLIRELTAGFARLDEQVDDLEEKQRNEAQALKDDLQRVKDLVLSMVQRLAAVEQRCTTLEKQVSDADQRRWQLLIAVLTCFFTGVIALVVALLKK